MEQFGWDYYKLSHLSKDYEILNEQTKHKLFESLVIALTALQLGDSYMKSQCDTNLKSMDELKKQTELTRTLIEKKKLLQIMKALPQTSVTLKL